tara:strand:- start:2518 stop:2730 length:213 start_codon:yes stop_codon:yes gene_type:complete
MDKVIKMITGVLSTLTDLAIHLLVAAVILGILFGDQFGVLANIGGAMETIGSNGVAGLITVAVVAMWMKK